MEGGDGGGVSLTVFLHKNDFTTEKVPVDRAGKAPFTVGVVLRAKLGPVPYVRASAEVQKAGRVKSRTMQGYNHLHILCQWFCWSEHSITNCQQKPVAQI